MTRGKVIQRIIELQPVIFERQLGTPNRCILATSVGIDVLAHFGIDARPLSVKVQILNAAWVKWIRAGSPGGATLVGQMALKNAGGWAVVAGDEDGPEERPGHWNGHLVIELPGLRAVMDLDLQQMARPQKGIVIPPAAVFHLADEHGGEYQTQDGGLVQITAKRGDESFRVARDWADQAKRRPLVDQVIRAIRKGAA